MHTTDIDVAVNLVVIVGRTADVMLNELSTFEHSHLCKAIAHLHTHEVATNGSTITLATATTLHNVGIEHFTFAGAIRPRRP